MVTAVRYNFLCRELDAGLSQRRVRHVYLAQLDPQERRHLLTFHTMPTASDTASDDRQRECRYTTAISLSVPPRYSGRFTRQLTWPSKKKRPSILCRSSCGSGSRSRRQICCSTHSTLWTKVLPLLCTTAKFGCPCQASSPLRSALIASSGEWNRSGLREPSPYS